jgi:hypothetical protein
MTYDPRYQPQQPQNPGYGQAPQQTAYPGYPGYPGAGQPGQPGYSNAYAPYGGYAPPRPSPLGTTSFVFGLISSLGLGALVVIAGVMSVRAGGRMDDKSAEAIALGLGLIFGMFLALIGAILGLVAVMQTGRKKLLGILGLVFNGGILLLVLLLMVIGLSMK